VSGLLLLPPCHQNAGHRTALSPAVRFNDADGLGGRGGAELLQRRFYRRLHQWHHRYTHQPGWILKLRRGHPQLFGWPIGR